jgi:hypothetical protein
MPVDYQMLLNDLGELCNISDVMNDVLKTYEKRKNLLNKLVSNDYLLKNSNIFDIDKDVSSPTTTPSRKSTTELQILKDILNVVKKDQICEEHKTTPESPELVENICKTLIKNNDFREFFKDILYECNNCSRLNNDEKKIKVELLVNNNNDEKSNNRKYSIGICSNHMNQTPKSDNSSRGYKRKYQHVCDEETVETQTNKMKSILKKVSQEPIKKQRFIDRNKPNIRINNNLSYYTE